MDGPDPYDLWMQAGGHPDAYRRLCIAAAEEEPLPDLPHEPGGPHCGVGGAPKPDHPRYRRCTCGQWYCWAGNAWVPGRPSARWLREHGLADPAAFWEQGGGHDDGSPFGEFAADRWRRLRYLLRALFG